MKTSIRSLLLVLALAAGTSGSASAEVLKSGVFEVKLAESAEKSVPINLPQIAFIKSKDGYTVAERKEAQQWLVLGKFKDLASASVKLPAKGEEKLAPELKITSAKAEKFSGIVQIGGKSVPFTATLAAAGTFYRCGNHVKAHLAYGSDEVVKLTESQGCADWAAESSSEGFFHDLTQLQNLIQPQ